MRYISYPKSTETISWLFEKNISYVESSSKNESDIDAIKQVSFIDELVEILYDSKLLLPTVIYINGHQIGEPPITYSKNIDIDFEAIKKKILNDFRDYASKIQYKLCDSLIKIDGYGEVIDNKNTVITDRLISIEIIDLTKTVFFIKTNKSLWVPLSIDTDYSYSWQFELWENNSLRLTSILLKVYHIFNLKVSPDLNEIDNNNPIWIKGFELFNSPETINNSLDKMLNNIDFSADKYFDYYLNGASERPTFSYKKIQNNQTNDIS
ncbi:MAG: hypothetical protein ACK5Z2_01360 [Bacteroidota bacterium]|jgi:hypothetical protein